ncbi:hypothetical protein [Vibrio sp. HN007]|uniref:hypothetical protein n=1 Tax=Vibrio iocasae TaxID=3098914 RepID=UPI0035D4C034
MNQLSKPKLNSKSESVEHSLDKSIGQYGQINNVIGVLASNPDVFEEFLNIGCYSKLYRLFKESAFNLDELKCIWHSISEDSLLEQQNKKLTTLHCVVRNITDKKAITDKELKLLADNQFSQKQILELIAGLSQTLMTAR